MYKNSVVMSPAGVIKRPWDFRKGSCSFKGKLMVAKLGRLGWAKVPGFDSRFELEPNRPGLVGHL